MEKENKFIHLFLVPFTGLGNYQGFRGNSWLKNRLTIFEQFVIPSLLNQTNKKFIIWIAWRREEKFNSIVRKFKKRLESIKELKFIHTHTGIPFYDDKYEDKEARERLINSLHGALGDLINETGEVDYVYMTIQPSDDVYCNTAVEQIQNGFNNNPNIQALGFNKGYIMNYPTKELREYNPTTNPPFVTVKFPRDIFIDPLKHCEYTALKYDIDKYKKDCPCPSHEYYPDVFGDKYKIINERGFIVGIHGNNISTTFNHRFTGNIVNQEILKDFNLYNVPPLKIKYSFKKRIYDFLRS